MNSAKAELHNLIENLSEHQANKLKKIINLCIVEFLPNEQEEELIFEPLHGDELNEVDKIALQQAKAEIARGETIPAEQVFKELGI